MNKITSTLAGLALVAGASIAPAFAQDNGGNLFAPPGNFSFTTTGTGLSASGTGESFNSATGGTTTPVSFTLMGTQVSGTVFSVTNFSVFTGATTLDALDGNSGLLFVASINPTTGGQFISSIGASRGGTTFNLTNPVPEASTTVSFGVLLALGGLAVVLRRKSVKNAA
jgi:hypothetical protein